MQSSSPERGCFLLPSLCFLFTLEFSATMMYHFLPWEIRRVFYLLKAKKSHIRSHKPNASVCRTLNKWMLCVWFSPVSCLWALKVTTLGLPDQLASWRALPTRGTGGGQEGRGRGRKDPSLFSSSSEWDYSSSGQWSQPASWDAQPQVCHIPSHAPAAAGGVRPPALRAQPTLHAPSASRLRPLVCWSPSCQSPSSEFQTPAPGAASPRAWEPRLFPLLPHPHRWHPTLWLLIFWCLSHPLFELSDFCHLYEPNLLSWNTCYRDSIMHHFDKENPIKPFYFFKCPNLTEHNS